MKILIADDEPLIRRSLQKIFERSGHDCVLAEDGQQALELWQKESAEILILDVLMPGLTGPEVIAEIKAPPSVAIVLISAYTGDYDMEKAQSLGADLFIEKPFEDLSNIVDKVLSVKQAKL